MSDGYVDIHWAAATCHVDKLRTILASPDVDVNVETTNGWTALHVAARSGYTMIIEELLADGRIDVHVRNADGQTALHMASDCNHTAAANCLLAHGDTSSIERELALERMEVEERTRVQNDKRLGLDTTSRMKLEQAAALNAMGAGATAEGSLPPQRTADSGVGVDSSSSRSQPAESSSSNSTRAKRVESFGRRRSGKNSKPAEVEQTGGAEAAEAGYSARGGSTLPNGPASRGASNSRAEAPAASLADASQSATPSMAAAGAKGQTATRQRSERSRRRCRIAPCNWESARAADGLASSTRDPAYRFLPPSPTLGLYCTQPFVSGRGSSRQRWQETDDGGEIWLT